MSRLWAEPLSLGLDQDGVALLRGSAELLFDGPPAVAGLADTLAATGTTVRNRLLAPTLGVTVADRLVRYWLVQPPANIASLAALRAVTAARFEQLFGETAQNWRMDADWSAKQAFLACALPATLCADVERLAAVHGWRLATMLPAFVRALNLAGRQASGWFCMGEGLGLSYAAIQQGRWLCMRSIRFAQPPSQAELLAKLEGEARLLALSHEQLPEDIRWQGSAAWLPRDSRFGPWRSSFLATQASGSAAHRLALLGSKT
ncbi:hypothetical protein FNU76_04090 [Chitinimonas arctica]|uniref:Uncharacterized protein n=1 Tax=Chitinimonas arctica TaxID=2594795 RepID=A0A516SBS6_9NEIS|nr:hypothetical protein [Chitinimonas arctica]QDQ25597.1 hypothetical protein FNU76_04090 [Chitinimonas arctica]